LKEYIYRTYAIYSQTRILCRSPKILKQVQDDDFTPFSSNLSVTPVFIMPTCLEIVAKVG